MNQRLHVTELVAGSTADLDAVNAIMREAFEPRYGEAWTPSQVLGMFSLPGVWLTLALVDGTPAGFALSRSTLDEGELLLIAVRPVARGRAVGGALLRSVIAEARERGLAKLHLEVRAGNSAVRLYARAGFAKVGERRLYYRGTDGRQHDAHSYALALTDPKTA